MTSVKRILISGFRGILSPLPIDFIEGSQCRSAILYGANGTGKSSITDAWEWLTTGKILHLSREGAEEGGYAHSAAKTGTSFVEVSFSDPVIETVRLDFDHNRITKPKPSDNLDMARKLITHPCHIRYGDLTRFVFMRKAERYDALASLMGFVPQMEYQKSLRRVQTNYQREVDELRRVKNQAESRFKAHFDLKEVNVNLSFERIVAACINYGIATDPTIESVRLSNEKIQTAVANDPNAKKLADYRSLEAAVKSCSLQPNLSEQVLALRDAIGRVKAEQKEQLATQLLIPLFHAAEEFLSKIEPSGQCPLCGLRFEGDLQEHVKNELAKMRHMEELLNHLKACRDTITRTLSAQVELIRTFDSTLDNATPDVNKNLLHNFRSAAENINALISRLRTLLSFDSTSITDELIDSLRDEEASLAVLEVTFGDAKEALLRGSDMRRKALEKDPVRVKLVADAQFIYIGLSLIEEIQRKATELEQATEVMDEYSNVVEDYVSVCLADVQRRFDEISDRVKIYFELLEKNSQGLGEPRLRLLPDQDRSVVLEVFFHGEMIQPAYKYLSESQLNSFGLAVFLASATHFNKDCNFLILDDVVSSFDSYKRPLLIYLLKQHLQDRQILLLTHDRFYRELLYRNLPSWKRIDFTSYTFGVGPTMYPGMQTLEKVEEALNRDEPEQACRTLAQYMEDVLQEIVERFQCEVKFNRRNEYTLDTLLIRLRVRVQDKLKADHPLSRALVDLLDAPAYRNWSSHCKNPVSPVHKDEVKEVLKKWKGLESQVICQEENCYEILRYDDKGGFVCQCGKTRLSKVI